MLSSNAAGVKGNLSLREEKTKGNRSPHYFQALELATFWHFHNSMKSKAIQGSSVEERNTIDIPSEACALKGIGTLDFSIKTKGRPQTQPLTNGHQANSPKVNMNIDYFGEFDPNVVHFTTAVVRWSGCPDGSPSRSPSVPASCRPAAADLRRVASRIRSVGRPSLETHVARHTSGGLSVGQNTGSLKTERQ